MNARALVRRVLPPSARELLWRLRHDGPGVVCREWRARRLVRAGRFVATARAAGLTLDVDLRDAGVGLPLYTRREFGAAEAAVMGRLLRPGDTVLDAGANVGVLSCVAARLVGPAGRVLAVEPDPDNLTLLRRNADRNAPGVVSVVPAAAGERAGELALHRSPENFGDHRVYAGPGGAGRATVPVPVVTLDSVAPEGVDFLKLDIQGYEHHALKGAAAILANPRLRAVLTEFWPLGIAAAGGDPDACLALLAGSGLRCHLLEADGSLTPATPADAHARIAAKFRPDEPEGAFVSLVFTRQ